MLILGVDPGLSGALALHRPASGDVAYALDIIDMPVTGVDAQRRVDAVAILDWIGDRKVDRAFIERVQPMPSARVIKDPAHEQHGERVSMPAARAFAFGDACATVRTVVVCLRIPWSYVAPVTWQATFKLRRKDLAIARGVESSEIEEREKKEASRLKAIDIFPGRADLFSRKKDEARAEAALIAVHGADVAGLVPWDGQDGGRGDRARTSV